MTLNMWSPIKVNCPVDRISNLCVLRIRDVTIRTGFDQSLQIVERVMRICDNYCMVIVTCYCSLSCLMLAMVTAVIHSLSSVTSHAFTPPPSEFGCDVVIISYHGRSFGLIVISGARLGVASERVSHGWVNGSSSERVGMRHEFGF